MKFDHVTGKCVDLSFEGKGVVKLSYGTVLLMGYFREKRQRLKSNIKELVHISVRYLDLSRNHQIGFNQNVVFVQPVADANFNNLLTQLN